MITLHSSIPAGFQLPLIHVVESDDVALSHQADAHWFHLLREIDFQPFAPMAAHYYEALSEFNANQQAQRERMRQEEAPPNPETEEEATLRLIGERPSFDPDAPILHEAKRRYGKDPSSSGDRGLLGIPAKQHVTHALQVGCHTLLRERRVSLAQRLEDAQVLPMVFLPGTVDV